MRSTGPIARGRVADYDLFHQMGGVLSGSSQPLTMGELSRAPLRADEHGDADRANCQVRDGHVERLSDPNDRRRSWP